MLLSSHVATIPAMSIQRPPSIRSVTSNASTASGVSLTRRSRTRTRARTLTGAPQANHVALQEKRASIELPIRDQDNSLLSTSISLPLECPPPRPPRSPHRPNSQLGELEGPINTLPDTVLEQSSCQVITSTVVRLFLLCFLF